MFELPFSLLSFIIYKTTRIALKYALMRSFSTRPETAQVWRAVDSRSFQDRMTFLAMHVFGPRWNPHAVLAMTGPLTISREFSVGVSDLDDAAGIWTVTAYRCPAKLAAHCHSSEKPCSGRFDVATGEYVLTVRLYDVNAAARFPMVSVDGKPLVAPKAVESTGNEFYQNLHRRGLISGYLMHCYVFYLLRFQRWLPRSFVHNEFLPAGDPYTSFRYGTLSKGQCLRIRATDDFLSTHRVYFSIYNCSSLLTDWGAAETCEYVSAPAKSRGYFLVRIVRRQPTANDNAQQCKVEVGPMAHLHKTGEFAR